MTIFEILGIAQDGGIPHLGCSCDSCLKRNHMVASALIENDGHSVLIDSSPDIRFQIRKIPDAVILTHLHIGHYVGLLQLGKEVASTRNLPVYCTPAVAEFLHANRPFSYLLSRGNITIQHLTPNQNLTIFGITITPIPVPHRNEDGDTIGIQIEPHQLLYIPDIDYLSKEVGERMRACRFVLFDGTFYSGGELLRQEDVPHPPIKSTMEILGRPENKIYFTHLNHTNPLLDGESPERLTVIENGYGIAYEGLKIRLEYS